MTEHLLDLDGAGDWALSRTTAAAGVGYSPPCHWVACCVHLTWPWPVLHRDAEDNGGLSPAVVNNTTEDMPMQPLHSDCSNQHQDSLPGVADDQSDRS